MVNEKQIEDNVGQVELGSQFLPIEDELAAANFPNALSTQAPLAVFTDESDVDEPKKDKSDKIGDIFHDGPSSDSTTNGLPISSNTSENHGMSASQEALHESSTQLASTSAIGNPAPLLSFGSSMTNIYLATNYEDQNTNGMVSDSDGSMPGGSSLRRIIKFHAAHIKLATALNITIEYLGLGQYLQSYENLYHKHPDSMEMRRAYANTLILSKHKSNIYKGITLLKNLSNSEDYPIIDLDWIVIAYLKLKEYDQASEYCKEKHAGSAEAMQIDKLIKLKEGHFDDQINGCFQMICEFLSNRVEKHSGKRYVKIRIDVKSSSTLEAITSLSPQELPDFNKDSMQDLYDAGVTATSYECSKLDDSPSSFKVILKFHLNSGVYLHKVKSEYKFLLKPEVVTVKLLATTVANMGDLREETSPSGENFFRRVYGSIVKSVQRRRV